MSKVDQLSRKLANAEFVKEAHRLDQLTEDIGAEIAFVGRSNSGKSSVINRLCQRKSLARTSRTPGRTQQFVVFEFAPGERIIDLPGFGFAKVSKAKREHWGQVIPRYLETRRSLVGLVLVVDIRHPFKPQESEVMNWCIEAGLPILVLLNKCDKLNQKEMAASLKLVKAKIGEGHELLSVEYFSALKGRGVEQALTVIQAWLDGVKVQD